MADRRVDPSIAAGSAVSEMNERSREIFRAIVEGYMETGEPVGSRTLSRMLGMSLSPATIRNVMADLEDLGLLSSPHISAGRLPTESGLRLFVDGLLEIGGIGAEERRRIDAECAGAGRSPTETMDSVAAMLSGLSQCAGLVMAPKRSRSLKHIEFVSLAPGRCLVVMVDSAGLVENRVMETPPGLPASALVEASNFLAARLVGRTLEEARAEIAEELTAERSELDSLASRVVAQGLATWSGEATEPGGALIVHGRHSLLDDVAALSDLERIRRLFETLERKETMLKLVETAEQAEGVQIFIGSESALFGLAGCSVVIAPYMNSDETIVGAIGVVGPTRINYARIIPMVDYTAAAVSRLLG